MIPRWTDTLLIERMAEGWTLDERWIKRNSCRILVLQTVEPPQHPNKASEPPKAALTQLPLLTLR